MTTYPNYSGYPDLYPNQSNLASASLLVRSGPAAGSRIDVPSTGLLFGRAASPAGQLARDQFLSSQHARVYFANGGLVIEDGPSRNGTYKNGQRISGPQLLQPGDVITLGATQVQVLATPTTAPAPLHSPAAATVLPTSPPAPYQAAPPAPYQAAPPAPCHGTWAQTVPEAGTVVAQVPGHWGHQGGTW